MDFRKELEQVINRHSRENGSNTPDFILAVYLVSCLRAFDDAVNCRESWYGRQNDEARESRIDRARPHLEKCWLVKTQMVSASSDVTIVRRKGPLSGAGGKDTRLEKGGGRSVSQSNATPVARCGGAKAQITGHFLERKERR